MEYGSMELVTEHALAGDIGALAFLSVFASVMM
jgi:hypothetical protein